MENKFLEAMNFRHACKEFDETKKISQNDFDTILEYGVLSPSSFGYEPWKFLVIQNEELRKKMLEFTWGASGTLLTASHFVIILARKKSMKYGSEYISDLMANNKKLPLEVQNLYKEFYENFQKNDFKLLESERTLFDWSCKQTYIALANMMSGAAYMGIDSCPVEGFNREKAEEFLKNELRYDLTEYGISVMVPFGYRKASPQRQKTRQKREDLTKYYN